MEKATVPTTFCFSFHWFPTCAGNHVNQRVTVYSIQFVANSPIRSFTGSSFVFVFVFARRFLFPHRFLLLRRRFLLLRRFQVTPAFPARGCSLVDSIGRRAKMLLLQVFLVGRPCRECICSLGPDAVTPPPPFNHVDDAVAERFDVVVWLWLHYDGKA